MSKGRKGAPTADELRLWRQMTKSVAPLGARSPPASPADEPGSSKRKALGAPATPARPTGAPRPRPSAPPMPHPIDRRTVSRLGRGTIAIDARVDLHGMTQAMAHGRLHRFLREAQAKGAKVALVITGKGRADADASGDDRGVLRRMVPVWLASAEMRQLVVGFGEAGPVHGGGGAIYVKIRRGHRQT